jgi:hypothetical protein
MNMQTAPTNCVLDFEHALALLGGDRQLYGELAGFVLEDAPLLLSELGEAINRRRKRRVERHRPANGHAPGRAGGTDPRTARLFQLRGRVPALDLARFAFYLNARVNRHLQCPNFTAQTAARNS